ncbi:MAG: helix-turn-helix domain-containing protein [Lachnospiraceae bacterium]|nr:helix-turn-helix domain-containing protein [Lachnospiraceae bacterium]
MSRISLCIADLRKKSRMSQQEMADSIDVSFQTISKWETGISMPDITVLPLLAENFWNHKLEYLLRTRKGYWNDDYARFLVSQVWKKESKGFFIPYTFEHINKREHDRPTRAFQKEDLFFIVAISKQLLHYQK